MPLDINPPLLNPANPWATTLADLRALYECPYTGAVTTRTTLLEPFAHDDKVHQYAFFDTHSAQPTNNVGRPGNTESASLNTLGYSPIPLRQYLEDIQDISRTLAPQGPGKQNNGDAADPAAKSLRKPIIISVTGSVDEIVTCYRMIVSYQHKIVFPLAIEINLSCPNIPDKPPPAYSGQRLAEYLVALQREKARPSPGNANLDVPIGIKTPPYTYADQFTTLINALLRSSTPTSSCPISFITATNTLGSSLVLSSASDTASHQPALHSANGTGIGGLAGAPLHALALGNVYTLHQHIMKHPQLSHVQIIGVGGVHDADGYRRMRSVGATAVGVGTALGRKGVDVFRELAEELGWTGRMMSML